MYFTKIIFIILCAIFIALFYNFYFLYKKIAISKEIVEKAIPFQIDSEDRKVSLLVVGDSTGVGVGAINPEDSVAGRLSSKIGATSVENYSVSGAVTADLFEQIKKAKLSSYDYILIQIGGNDIIRFHNIKETASLLEKFITELPKSNKVIVMSAGDVGSSNLFPFFLRPFYTKLNLELHDEFNRIVSERGFIYVNLYERPENDPFRANPSKYFSPDGLHPSSSGYGLWFDKIPHKNSL